jgi:hypothetical protein
MSRPPDGDPVRKVRLDWDRRTLTLIEPGAGYGRMIRLRDKSLLCSYEKAGKSWVRKSRDEGRTWQPPVLAAQFSYGAAANPEPLLLRNGRLLLFYNARPSDGVHRFAIGAAHSADGGATWTDRPTIFAASASGRDGCWEPAAIQLPSGEIQLFFANEYPYKSSDEQEISLCRSFDQGETWSEPRAVSCRARHRDGMPVPLILPNGTVAVAIEDNGLTTGYLLQPAIVTSGPRGAWPVIAAGEGSPRRWGAVTPPLPAEIYAGAPYLRQLPGGETLLSCQSKESRPAVGGKTKARMVVYVGDREARNFSGPTVPFDVPGDAEGLWNSLFIKDADTVTALSGTVINGVGGLWAIDGHVTRAK